MKISIRRLLPLFLAALLTSFFCLALYFFNNKYTRQTVQPANGLMVVSEQDLDELLYLIDGWAFYPDVLLTPDDFASGSPKRYMVYTNIGDHTRFDTPGEPDTPYAAAPMCFICFFRSRLPSTDWSCRKSFLPTGCSSRKKCPLRRRSGSGYL